MTKFNMNVVSSDMRARLEFMMNIYNRLMLSNPEDELTGKNRSDYCSLNGYIKLMQCATNSKKPKKSIKCRANRPVSYKNNNVPPTGSHKSYKNISSASSVSSKPSLSRSPSSLLFDLENNSISNCFEETKRLLWMGCKAVDDALDVNRDLPMWVQTVDSNNIVKQLLASMDTGRVDKGNVHTLVAVFINFSITMIDMFAMNAKVDKHWWKYSYKIMEQLIDDINVHCRAKDPLNSTLKVKGKSGDRMLNKALSTITQLKKIIPVDKTENSTGHNNIHNPMIPLVLSASQQSTTFPPTLPPTTVDFNASNQQYMNYNGFSNNQNYINGYGYPSQFQATPNPAPPPPPLLQMNRPPYSQMQYRPPYQPAPYQQYANQVRVNQPQYCQYMQQQPPNSWPNTYQKPAYQPVHNGPFPSAQFAAVANPQPKPEAKLIEVKEDDEKKWLEAQKDAKQLVNNAMIATRSTDSSNTSNESEEGLVSLRPTFERMSDRDSICGPLPDDTDRMWNFLAREVDKKVRYKFQKMIREMQDIPKDEFHREPELFETTYQNVVRIQLFEPIRCKMINKKYENVQAVVRDFRLVFSTFRHISQSNDVKCKLMMDFMERYFNECLRKYFRGWNLDKYRPGVVDTL
ncbi:uncharacterized protein LOC126901828 isoform X2 [Daktulosphaira vitifoliae]|uniref:uncharacterized protein LOC126901828 isoform X2 n=1 Tax=Daktulosphaira vitifoliae TaxID=58002 RepID=UPI0021AA464C|nr:uncharacterized protein LOC126901828 isoform X2 [Daktulosphaira vitifoliae]